MFYSWGTAAKTRDNLISEERKDDNEESEV